MPTETIGQNTADTYTGCIDNEILEANPASNWNGFGISAQALNGSSGRCGLIAFPGLSNISASAIISAATLNIYKNESYGAVPNITLRRLLRNWSETQSTPTIFSTGNPWDSLMAQTDAVDRISSVSATTAVSSSNDVWTVWDVLTDVAGFVDGSLTNYGWLVESSAQAAFFRSSSYATDGFRPYLSVTYTLPGGTFIGSALLGSRLLVGSRRFMQ